MRAPTLNTLHRPLHPALQRLFQRHNIHIYRHTTKNIRKILRPRRANMINQEHMHKHRHNLYNQRRQNMPLTLKKSLGSIKKCKTINRWKQLKQVVAYNHRGFIVDVLEK